jgi:hypothetical protein
MEWVFAGELAEVTLISVSWGLSTVRGDTTYCSYSGVSSVIDTVVAHARYGRQLSGPEGFT